MKKFFFFAIAALGMMAGCQKQEINDVQKPVDDSDRVAVQFNIDAPSLTIAKTKGAGPVEAWANQDLYVLGYKRTTTSFELTNALIPNVKTSAPASGKENEIDVVRPADDAVAPGEPYYYADGKDAVYDFYGYYVDDAAGANTLTAEATGASIALTINGTQDVMAAKADPVYDIEFCENENGRKIPSTTAYSAYAARRGVHPTLTFNHMLTRFNFHVVAGAESAKNIVVESISLDSYDDVVLTVAPVPALAKAANETAKAVFTLDGVNANAPYTPYPYAAEQSVQDAVKAAGFEYDTADLLEDDKAKAGKSIMAVAGETSHKITLRTVLSGKQTVIPPLDLTLEASSIVDKDGKNTLTAFQAGYQYDVILTVYGPEEVKITAVLSDWKEGGSSVIDPDDEFVAEPTTVSAELVGATATSLTYEITTPNNYVDGEAYLTDAAGTVLTESFVPTKAKTATVTFEGLTDGTEYTFTVKVRTDATVGFDKIEAAKDVKIESTPAEVTIVGSVYAYDKDSYNQIPAYYRTMPGKSWSEYSRDYETWVANGKPAGFDPLPWLVVWFLPMENEATLTVNDCETFPIPAGKQVATIAPREIYGIDAFVPGETYTVKITSNGKTASVDIKVPEAETPEVEEPVVVNNVKKSYVVLNTKESYEQLPLAYRTKYGEWGTNGLSESLPWLAIETTPGVEATFKFTREDYTKTLKWTVGEIGLCTFSGSADELDVQSLVGEWTVDVTINGKTETVTLTVPAE